MARYAGRPRDAIDDVRSLVDNAIEGIFRTTPKGEYLIANRALATMYRYDSVDELIGSMTDIGRQLYVDPQRRQLFRMLLNRQDRVSGFEAEVRCKDGSCIWIREKARVVRDAAGKVVCYEGFVEDITEQRRTLARLGRWERAGRGSLHGIAIVSGAEGALVETNPAFVALFGGAAPPTTASALLALLEPSSPREAWLASRATLMAAGVAFADPVVLRVPGMPALPAQVGFAPQHDGFESTGEAVLTIVRA